MVLQRWYPFLEMRRINNRLIRPSPGFTPAVNGADRREWSIPLDIVQEEDKFVVRASLPGIAPENIEVSVDHGVLTIKGRAEVEAEDQREEGVQRQLLLPVPSIILAGSPPVPDCAAGPLRCGSWGRRIPG